MVHSRTKTPPFSPVLFAGFALRPLPPALLQPLADLATAVMSLRHRDVFERLEALGDPTFLIDPVDLPFSFLFRPALPTRCLQVVRDERELEAPGATIRAPLLLLVDLLQGRLDGDALFFSREISVEGDTEAIVALRNAVDGAEIDVVADLLSILGPLAGPAGGLVRRAGRAFTRAAADLESLRDALNAPLSRRVDAQAAELNELKAKLAQLARRQRAKGRGAEPSRDRMRAGREA